MFPMLTALTSDRDSLVRTGTLAIAFSRRGSEAPTPAR